jgi:hypothetical protein
VSWSRRPGNAALGVVAVALACLALDSHGATARAAEDGLRIGAFVFAEPFGESEASRLRASGARVVRTPLLWHETQRLPGGPFDWSGSDRRVRASAEARLTVLPVLLGSPAWVAPAPTRAPSTKTGELQFARFALAAVRRYGRGGSFWRENPEVAYRPVTAWQVWNEPNTPEYASHGNPQPARVREAAPLRQRGDPHRRPACQGGAGRGAGPEAQAASHWDANTPGALPGSPLPPWRCRRPVRRGGRAPLRVHSRACGAQGCAR